MKLHFTKNNSIGSRLIRWILNEPVSHVAIEFSDGLVVHSKFFTGVTLEWTTEFHGNNSVVYSVDCSVHWRTRRHLLRFILDTHAKAAYDYKGLLWFAWFVILNKLFAKPFPTSAKWNHAHKFLCTELALKFLDGAVVEQAFITPFQLYKELTNGRI